VVASPSPHHHLSVVDEAKGDEAMTRLTMLADELTRERLPEAERHRLAASVESKGRLGQWILPRIGFSSGAHTSLEETA
jgi:hypothetical protein